MKKNTLYQTSVLLIITSLILTGCKQQSKHIEYLEEDVIANIKKDDWLFQSNMGCDQLSKYSSEWDVKGIYITKDSLIEMCIRKSYEYNNHPRHSGKVSYKKIRSVYTETFENISNRIKEYNYMKFGLLFYEGKYNCEYGVNIQKDTIMVLFARDYNNREYYLPGLIPGP